MKPAMPTTERSPSTQLRKVVFGVALMKKLLVAAALLFVTAGGLFAAQSSAKPNIILIFGDDVGLGDVHCSGGPFKTPNFDSLAAGGTRFEYCYAMPLCEPSRCMLLTGRYPFRTGLVGNHSNPNLPFKTEIMIPAVMKKAGYVSACIGKWSRLSFDPGAWGFDEYMSTRDSGRYWSDQEKHGYVLNGQEKSILPGEYLPDSMHNYIVGFLERNKDRPFLLYYPMEHIHVPILPTPDSKPGADKDQLYTDNVEYMDKLVGKLMAELDRLKLRENTLVIFTGDNGTAKHGVTALSGVKPTTVDGKPISGSKGSMLEGGSRVPLIVNWPGVTPAGKVKPDLIDISDFFSTFAELGGAKLPPGVTLDSHSFAAQIKGEKGTPREWVYVELSGKSYVRNARYKLTNGGELFDLREAPFKEIRIAKNTTDAAAIAARAELQKVLDQHPAGPDDTSGETAVKPAK